MNADPFITNFFRKQAKEETWRQDTYKMFDIASGIQAIPAGQDTPLEMVLQVYDYIYWQGLKNEEALKDCAIDIQSDTYCSFDEKNEPLPNEQWTHRVSFTYDRLKVSFSYHIVTKAASEKIEWKRSTCYNFQCHLVKGKKEVALLNERQAINEPFLFLPDVPKSLRGQVLSLDYVFEKKKEKARLCIEKKEKMRQEALSKQAAREERKASAAERQRQKMLRKYP